MTLKMNKFNSPHKKIIRTNWAKPIVSYIKEVLNKKLGLLVVDGLRKKRNTVSQQTLAREGRLVNLVGAFEAVGDTVKGKRVLLVDDVVTTGSTLLACAQALRAGGATEVCALCIAASQGDDSAEKPRKKGKLKN